MEPAKIAPWVGALAAVVTVAFAVACEGSDTRMRPEVPSDLTTTTGAAATPASPPRTDAPAASPPSPIVDDEGPHAASSTGPSAIGEPAAPEDSRREAIQTRHPAAAAFNDSEIAAVIDAASRAERRLAREALKRATSGRVRQLAQWVLNDHSAAKLEKVERSVSLMPLENATSTDLVSSAERMAEGLASSSDQDFDRLSVDAIAGEERRIVQLLDGELIPQAQNAQLRTLLQDMRTSASSRLGMADELRSSSAH